MLKAAAAHLTEDRTARVGAAVSDSCNCGQQDNLRKFDIHQESPNLA